MSCQTRRISRNYVIYWAHSISYAGLYQNIYAEVTAPLVELTKKQYKQQREFDKHWGTTQSETITRIKKLLSSPPILHFPDHSKEFIVHVDASEAGVGAFVAQNANEGSDKRDLEIIAYFSERFTKGQKTLFSNDERVLWSCPRSATLASVLLGQTS